MFRLARASRLPLRRYIQTQASSSSRPSGSSAGYLLGAGIVAGVAYGEYNDSEHSNQPTNRKGMHIRIAPELSCLFDSGNVEQPDFETFVRQRLVETRRTQVKPNTSSSASTATAEHDASENSGAFNPETGEINWDCPCLGGMADGPCGEEFRAAFSCFIYSEVEPKGMDCVEKFQGMQTCFRAHPEVYAAEIADDEAAEAALAAEQEAEKASTSDPLPPTDVPSPAATEEASSKYNL
ncbi:CHCH domain-containing protein [Mycena indigotica]|uniref:Mitochondrial intermembrane space import and assembly protein 40 n=1 Tax=Mycena indigotica TaxID=2126181 RepID=A0A8H6WF93_9AGAR|nr:CHCH domain-containing protein [Mycena indigotica]KAF7315587.1 CHCH domain-containing protein [Mycena indigotica]